jgi:hypothetical protein
MRSTFASFAAREAVRKFGAVELGMQTVEKLALHIGAAGSGDTIGGAANVASGAKSPTESAGRSAARPGNGGLRFKA